MSQSDFDLARWYRKPWMTDDQWACAKMFADVVGGFHHVCSGFKPFGDGITIHHMGGGFATVDFDRLTRLVILAHDQMVRVQLIPSGPGRIGFALWKRHKRDGAMSERCPTMETAISYHRPRPAPAGEGEG